MQINSPFRCCDNYQKIVGILTNYLFNNNPNCVLDDRYEQMRTLVNSPSPKWGTCAGFTIVQHSKDTLLQLPTGCFPGLAACLQYSNLGHDLPYWIEVPNEKGRIMLVSQDPLRKKQCPGTITLSSPFGMHSIDYRGKRVMTQMVDSLLNNGYSVYLTDFNKLYGTYQNKPVVFNCMRQLFADILNREICFWEPTRIIAVGNVAKKALDQGVQAGIINTQGILIKKIPHPNAHFCKNTKLSELNNALATP